MVKECLMLMLKNACEIKVLLERDKSETHVELMLPYNSFRA